jgi:threonylcarbamoyladenosine tRNA methylthiotransferase MtaB
MEILFEGDKLGILEGLSSNYIRVYTAKTKTNMRALEQVKLEETYHDGLWGKMIE